MEKMSIVVQVGADPVWWLLIRIVLLMACAGVSINALMQHATVLNDIAYGNTSTPEQ